MFVYGVLMYMRARSQGGFVWSPAMMFTSDDLIDGIKRNIKTAMRFLTDTHAADVVTKDGDSAVYIKVQPKRELVANVDIKIGGLVLVPLTPNVYMLDSKVNKVPVAGISLGVVGTHPKSGAALHAYATGAKPEMPPEFADAPRGSTAKRETHIVPFWFVKRVDHEALANMSFKTEDVYVDIALGSKPVGKGCKKGAAENGAPSAGVKVSVPVITNKVPIKKGDVISMCRPK